MLFVNYCENALKKAQYKQLNDGTWFADIEGFQGVWGQGLTIEECRNDLLEVLEEWMILKLQDGDPLPIVNDIEIKVSTVSDI